MLNKILAFYTKYFAFWVLLGGVLAYFKPEIFVGMKGGMNWFFALTMFGIGAVLQLEDFKRIVQKPVIVLIGCSAQFIIMPVGAFVLARLFGLGPELTVGLILTGSAPGAMASNVMSYISKADTAYSVSLTTVSTLLCPILTPVLTKFLAGSVLPVPVYEMFMDVVMVVIVPLGMGFCVRHFFKDKIEKITAIFPAISVTFIIFICSLVIALNQKYLAMMTFAVLIVVVILNIYGMCAGFGIGSFFKMSVPRRRTLSIEIGMQNAGLGTVLALKHFNQRAAIPAVLFVFVCIITASIMAEIWQRKSEKARSSIVR